MSKKSHPQILIEYSLTRAIFGSFSALPRSVSLKFGDLLATASYPFLNKLRRVGTRNLEIAFPEKPAAEREMILKKSFANLGRILGEFSQFNKTTPEKLGEIIEFQFDENQREVFERAKSEGRGAIIISPHLGNWELLVLAYSALVEPISYLARPLDNPLIEQMTVDLRTRFGNRPINKSDSVTTAIKILRKGGILGILADVNAHPKEGVFVPFFGTPACTSSGVAMLARRTNAVIVPMCGVWNEAKKKYIAVHESVIEPAITKNREQDILETTAQFTAAVERLIRRFPDQWLWIHRRWKTRPPGEPDLYAGI